MNKKISSNKEKKEDIEEKNITVSPKETLCEKNKRNRKEIDEIIDYLENEDFKAVSWMKNFVMYLENTDCFQVELQFEYGHGRVFSYEEAKEMWLENKKEEKTGQ
jgi:hypothetical protein